MCVDPLGVHDNSLFNFLLTSERKKQKQKNCKTIFSCKKNNLTWKHTKILTVRQKKEIFFLPKKIFLLMTIFNKKPTSFCLFLKCDLFEFGTKT